MSKGFDFNCTFSGITKCSHLMAFTKKVAVKENVHLLPVEEGKGRWTQTFVYGAGVLFADSI